MRNLREICDSLACKVGAQSVVFLDLTEKPIVWAGSAGDPLDLSSLPSLDYVNGEKSIYVTVAAEAVIMVVSYDSNHSPRDQVWEAVVQSGAAIERLVESGDLTRPPPTSGNGGQGAPAQVFAWRDLDEVHILGLHDSV